MSAELLNAEHLKYIINEPDTNYRNKIGTIFIEGHTDDVIILCKI